MIIHNLIQHKNKINLEYELDGEKKKIDVYKYSYYNWLTVPIAERINMIGVVNHKTGKQGVLPFWFFLGKITDHNCRITASGTLHDSHSGVPRQDYLNNMKEGGTLENNILYLKHEYNNDYDPLAIVICTEDKNGIEIDLGYIPRYRPNKKYGDPDSGETSNLQKYIASDQEKSLNNQKYIISNYKVIGGYDKKNYGLMIDINIKKQYPLTLA